MMWKIRAYALMGFVAAITACMAQPIALGPAAGAGPVVCDTGCTVAWQRAQFWIAKHSTMKVQSVSDVLVQTYNPTGSASAYGFTATREPLPDGKYRIVLQAVCSNEMIPCDVLSDDLEAAFNYYVATGRDVIAETGKSFSSIQ